MGFHEGRVLSGEEEKDPATGLAVWTAAGIPAHETRFGSAAKLRDRQLYYVADHSGLPRSEDDDEEVQPGGWLILRLLAQRFRPVGQRPSL